MFSSLHPSKHQLGQYLKTLLLLGAPFFMAASAIRLYVVSLAPTYLEAGLWLGVGADLAWSLLPAALVSVLPRGRLLVLLVGLLAWSLTHWLDAQSLLALGVASDYRDFHYALDPVFLKSTLSNVSIGAAMFGLLALLLLTLGCARLLRHAHFEKAFVLPGLLVVLGFVAVLVLQPGAVVSDWSQQNSVANQFRIGWQQGQPDALADNIMASRELLLAGEPAAIRAAPVTPPRNVLLIVLEGLPGAYLPSVGEPLSVPTPVQLPQLDTWAQQGWVASQFVNHSRQTLRGLYAILCADYPRLIGGTPKPLRQLQYPASGESCLPAQLQRAGYSTTYLQSADLGFMSKDVFMPMIGFAEVRGQESFSQARAVTNTGYSWGPTDAEFFAQVVPRLEAIDKEPAPWFVTLLTAGTHYPYGIEAEAGASVVDNKLSAVAAVDAAAANFLAQLQTRGLLANTLVVVTSDESHGVPGQPLGANWGLFFALAPDLVPAQVDAVFGSVDVSQSIMSYLGFAYPWGRSVFESHSQPRSLYFGHGTTLAVARDGLVHQCGVAALTQAGGLGKHCSSWRASGPISTAALFTNTYEELAGEAYEPAYKELIAAARLIDGDAAASALTLPIMGPGSYPVAQGWREFGGGQYVDLQQNVALEYTLQLKYHSNDNGAAILRLATRDGEDASDLVPALLLPTMRDGESIALRYTAAPGQAVARAQFKFELTQLIGNGELEVLQAQVVVRPQRSSNTEPVVHSAGYQFVLDASGAFMRALYTPGHSLSAIDQPGIYTQGWYQAEAGGIWSGDTGTLQIPLAQAPSGDLLLQAHSRVELTEQHPETAVDIWVNGQWLGSWDYRHAANWGDRELRIPARLITDALLTVEFRPRHTARPGGPQGRELGILLDTLVLTVP